MRDRTPDDYRMSFGDHLEELRSRLLRGFIAPLILLIPALIFGKEILYFLVDPVRDALIEAGLSGRLQALSPVEPFVTYFKVAFVVAVIFGAPIMVWQLWLFIAPGLYPQERKFAHLLLPMSFLLTTIGVAFMLYVVLPVSMAMLIRFTKGIDIPEPPSAEMAPAAPLPSLPILDLDPPNPQPGEYWFNKTLNQIRFQGEQGRIYNIDVQLGGVITQQFQLKTYVNLVFVFGLAFAIAFQMPVVILLLGWVGIVEVAGLKRVRRYAILVIVIFSAILTPPDVVSQVSLAIPLYMLYEFSILLLRVWPSPNAFARTAARRPPKEPE